MARTKLAWWQIGGITAVAAGMLYSGNYVVSKLGSDNNNIQPAAEAQAGSESGAQASPAVNPEAAEDDGAILAVPEVEAIAPPAEEAAVAAQAQIAQPADVTEAKPEAPAVQPLVQPAVPVAAAPIPTIEEVIISAEAPAPAVAPVAAAQAPKADAPAAQPAVAPAAAVSAPKAEAAKPSYSEDALSVVRLAGVYDITAKYRDILKQIKTEGIINVSTDSALVQMIDSAKQFSDQMKVYNPNKNQAAYIECLIAEMQDLIDYFDSSRRGSHLNASVKFGQRLRNTKGPGGVLDQDYDRRNPEKESKAREGGKAWDGLDRDELFEAYAACAGGDAEKARARVQEAKEMLQQLLKDGDYAANLPHDVTLELMLKHGTDALRNVAEAIKRGDPQYKFADGEPQILSLGKSSTQYSAVAPGPATMARIGERLNFYEGLLQSAAPKPESGKPSPEAKPGQ